MTRPGDPSQERIDAGTRAGRSRRRWLGAIGFVLVLASASAAQTIVVTGTVVDSATGRPLSGAILQFIDSTRSFGVRTDDVGGFDVQLPPSRYQIFIRRIGYAPLTSVKAFSAKTTTLELRMVPIPQTLRPVHVKGEGAGIYGEVAALRDLSKVVGARVQIAGANAKVATDSAGAFFVPVKAPGRYAVRITAPGYAMDFFTVDVAKDQVADASRYLISADKAESIPEMAWAQFDERLRWRSPMNYLFTSGGDLRRYGGDTRSAIEAVAAKISNTPRWGDFPPCVFLNGIPRPGIDLDAIDVADIKGIEVYGMDPLNNTDRMKEGYKFFMTAWTGLSTKCLAKKIPVRRGTIIAFVSIWTK
jgi:hypothetical protein